MNYHLLSTSEVQQKLNTGQQGLNGTDAHERIRTFGLNKLPDKKKALRGGNLFQAV
jgi:Ca2+-transporting ATPase